MAAGNGSRLSGPGGGTPARPPGPYPLSSAEIPPRKKFGREKATRKNRARDTHANHGDKTRRETVTKEQKYAAELQRLGIYDPAFDPTIHELAILEREQSRTRKAWKDASISSGDPSMLDRLYQVILQQGKMILQLRETLGLTPKSLKRFRAGFGTDPEETEEKPKTTLELLMEKRRNAG